MARDGYGNYLTTGSTRAMSVTGGRSKLETPAINALLTPMSTVDLYHARFMGDDTSSLGTGNEPELR